MSTISPFQLTTITRSLGGTAGPQVIFSVDAARRTTGISRTIGGSGTDVRTTITYDAANNAATITHGEGINGLATFAYVYDAHDRVTTETNAEGTVTYGYDATDQLTSVGGARTESYSYDSGGNRTMSGYTTTTGNRLSAGAGYTFTYDDEGNTTSNTLTSTGEKTDYTWDHRNRLTGVVVKNSGGTEIMRATYTYDPQGRRIGVQVDDDGAGAHAAVQTWHVYDGDNTYADFSGAGSLQTRFLHALTIDSLLARTDSGGTTSWYLTDRLGSVRDIASTAGAVIDHVSYSSFGAILTESAPSNGDRFTFTGREHDKNSSDIFYRSRIFYVTAGRFASEDHIQFRSGDYNLYRYVTNSAVNYTDPMGTNQEGAWVTAVSAGATGLVVGGAVGGVPGAIIGGVLGIIVGAFVGYTYIEDPTTGVLAGIGIGVAAGLIGGTLAAYVWNAGMLGRHLKAVDDARKIAVEAREMTRIYNEGQRQLYEQGLRLRELEERYRFLEDIYMNGRPTLERLDELIKIAKGIQKIVTNLGPILRN